MQFCAQCEHYYDMMEMSEDVAQCCKSCEKYV